VKNPLAGESIRATGFVFMPPRRAVVAHARVKTPPVQKYHSLVKHPEKFSYVFEVDSVSIYTEDPVVLSAELRAKLGAFQGRDLSKPWPGLCKA